MLFVTLQAEAQWSPLFSFNSQVFSTYFLRTVSDPQIGFVGTANGSIWRTTDNGRSWQKSTTPVNLNGPVTGFAFKDAATGWCSARQTSLTPGVFKTIDSGKTWTATSLNGEQTSVYYNPASRLLLTTSWSGRNARSTNDGLTWIPLGVNGNQNGIAFINGMNGVMTTYTANYSVTSDGGFTWSSVPFNEEAWQPLAIPGRGFYVAAERQRQIIRSTDNGLTWNIIHQFPVGEDINGDIHGDSNILYVQTRDRFLYSTNGGTLWIDHCGPGNAYDTRFYTVGDTLYAGTVDGNIWWNPFGTDRIGDLLKFSQNKMTFSSPGCFTVDSFFKFINTSTCYDVQLTDIGILGSSTFSIVKPSLPKTLQDLDSMKIRYSPDDFQIDSAKLTVIYTVNGKTFETKLDLYGNGLPGENIQLLKELDLLLASDCNDLDTAITVLNGPCDTLRIQSLTISAPSLFILTNNSSFPQTLGPGGSARIEIQVDGTTPGDYIASLIIRISTGGIERDTVVTLKLKVLSTKEPQAQLSSVRMAFDSVNICEVLYDTVWFKNSLCKPLKLTAVSRITGNPNYFIQYQPPLPHTLATDDSSYIVIRYTPTAPAQDDDLLKLTFEFDAVTKRDTTIRLSGIGRPICNASLGKDALSFEPVLQCEQAELTTFLRNFSCDSGEVIDIFGLSDSSFRIISPAKGTWIPPDDSVLIKISAVPLSDGAKFDSIRIIIRTINGAQQVLTLKVVGTVKPKVRILSLPSLVAIDSIAGCTSFDTSFTIYNFGVCDTLVIDSTTIAGPSWYSLIGGPITPSYIPPGDSATFIMRFSPGSSAVASGGLLLKGPGLDTIIMINVSSKKGGAPFVLSTDDSVFYAFLCKTATRSFSISNYGCDTLIIDSLFLTSNQQFFFSSQGTVPLRVAPNETSAFNVNFDPARSGDSLSILTIKSSSSGITRSIPLRGSLVGTKGTARFDIASTDNTAVITKPAGDVFSTKVVFKDDIDALRDLKSIVFDVRFNNNVLSVTNAVVEAPWRFDNRYDSTGLLRLTLSRTTASSITTDTKLATISFRVTIGDSSYSPIAISKVLLNGSDSIYHSCVLEPLALSGTVLQVDDTCGDAFIRGYINHDGSIFDDMIIVPNPTRGDRGITTSFDLNLAGDVTMAIFDINGKKLSSKDAVLAKGRHSMTISGEPLPAGQYLVGLESSGGRQMRRVLIVK